MFCIPVTQIRRFRHFSARLVDWFAHFAGDHLRHFFATGAQSLTDITHFFSTIIYICLAPVAKACCRQLKCVFDIVSASPRQHRKLFTRGRIY
ncbi:Uncharacterised protein [Shigella sonnei]|nr:Uncharacterised protein [Shigella sonnei]